MIEEKKECGKKCVLHPDCECGKAQKQMGCSTQLIAIILLSLIGWGLYEGFLWAAAQ